MAVIGVAVGSVVFGGVVVGCVAVLGVTEYFLKFLTQYHFFLWTYKYFRNNSVVMGMVVGGVVVRDVAVVGVGAYPEDFRLISLLYVELKGFQD